MLLSLQGCLSQAQLTANNFRWLLLTLHIYTPTTRTTWQNSGANTPGAMVDTCALSGSVHERKYLTLKATFTPSNAQLHSEHISKCMEQHWRTAHDSRLRGGQSTRTAVRVQALHKVGAERLVQRAPRDRCRDFGAVRAQQLCQDRAPSHLSMPRSTRLFTSQDAIRCYHSCGKRFARTPLPLLDGVACCTGHGLLHPSSTLCKT